VKMKHRMALENRKSSGYCDLCADNWLFILAAGGRTGSTTALSMLNMIPGFELSGEHWGLLQKKHFEFEQLREKDLNLHHPQYAGRSTDVEYLKCNVQSFIRSLVLGNKHRELLTSTQVLGFKEIRYTNVPMMRFLNEVFPCAQFVFTYRKKTDVAVRAAEFGDRTHTEWKNGTDFVLELHRMFESTTTLLPLEDLSVGHFNDLLRKLGVQQCSFPKVVHDNAGGGYEADPQKTRLHGTCDLSAVNFQLAPSALVHHQNLWNEYRGPEGVFVPMPW